MTVIGGPNSIVCVIIYNFACENNRKEKNVVETVKPTIIKYINNKKLILQV